VEIEQFTNGMFTFNYPELAQTYLDSIFYYSAAAFSGAAEARDTIYLKDFSKTRQPRNQFLYDLIDASQNNKCLFNRYVNLVGPDEIRLVDNIEIQTPTDNLALPLVKTKGKTLSFNQLSEGTFRTMALLFYLIGNDSGLVLIEEPENSVHPSLLRDIVEIMQNESERKQIIFSTHSDLVLSMLKPENVVFVDNGPDGTKTRSLSMELAHGNYKGLKSYLENEGDLGSYWKAGGFDD
jgi:predicted ATPase